MNEWKKVQLEDVLTESKIPVENDDIHKRLTVKLHLGGIYKREVRATDKTGSTKYYTRKSGQFVYGKQNLHNGALGIIPDHLDEFQSSQDIPAFDISENVNKKWLYYYFSRENFYNNLEKISTGTGSKRIQPKELLKLNIYLPSIQEQQKIAAILSSVEEAIDKTEQIIEQTTKVKKGLMQQLLTRGIGHEFFKNTIMGEIPEEWELMSLEDISSNDKSSIVDGPYGSSINTSTDYIESGIPVIRTVNIRPFNFISRDLRFISEQKFESLKRSAVYPGDILLSKVGTIGYACILPTTVDKAMLSTTGSCKITVNTNLITNKYLCYVLNFMKPYLDKIASEGVQPFLNMKDIKKLKIKVPSIKEQENIVSIISSVHNKISKEEEYLGTLNLIKKGLMQQLLTGKVRVSTGKDEVTAT